MHFESSLTMSVPIARVYAAFTDFESMPKWSKQVTAVRVLKREGSTVLLEAESGTGSQRPVLSEMRLSPPGSIVSEGETRFTSTKRTIVFEEVPSGTKVTATLDVRVKGIWRVFLMAAAGEREGSSMAEELASFGRYVEGLPP